MIGVAISTHKRPELLAGALEAWGRFLPDVLVVNNDEDGEGVPVTKNKGLAALMGAGCDHLFLVDDDVRPLTPNWYRRYVQSPEPHLAYLRPDGPTTWISGDLRESSTPNGVVLYVERRVVEGIGGMREEFGRYGSWHGEWSRRIHNAGFTTKPFMSFIESPLVWHALDYDTEPPESTVSQAERNATWAKRKHLRNLYMHSADYVEYRRDL